MQTTVTHLLDSGILISSLRGDDRAHSLIRTLARSGPLAVSAITVFEILRGAVTQRHESSARGIFRQFEVIDTNSQTADRAAGLAREFPGVFSGDRTLPDSLIAATAIVHGVPCVSLNQRQFAVLRGAGFNVVLIEQDAPDWTTTLA